MKKKILSVVLCVVMVLTTAVVPVSAVRSDTARALISAFDTGYPMSNVGTFLKGIYQVNKFVNNLVGVPLLNEKTMVVTVDDTVQGVVDSIIDAKGVDFSEVYHALPDIATSAELFTTNMNVDVDKLSTLLTQLAGTLRSNGNKTLANIVVLLRVWLNIVDSMQIVLTPVDGRDGVYRFDAVITYRDGSSESFKSNICYNKNNNEIEGLDGGPALLGFSMNFDQMYTYTGVNVWQRNFGFCLGYDLFCFVTPYIMNYVTERIKFVYDNREWMCQIWKGTYFITNGGEVGFYTRDIGSTGSFYNCASDDDMLTMSLEVYHGNDLILKREPVEHWWVTGFEVDDTCYLPASLTLISTITMKDKEMFDAFTAALDEKKNVIDYTTDGLDVTIKW